MKEVIEKTGLTDRAIRLYIDEGLALPNIEESYSGRKSIEFSESDVERLKNVALLRKAGFSIAEIKRLVDDETAAKDVVEKFIAETEKNIAEETEIVERLKKISFDEDVTFETICESLSETVEEKQVPKEDLKSVFWNRAEKNPYKAAGIFGLAFTGIVFIVTFLFWCSDCRHLAVTDSWFSDILLRFSCWIAMDVLCIILILLNRDKSTKRNRKFRRFISGTITVFSLLVGITAFYVAVLFSIVPPFCSLTTDINDYMVLDSWVERNYGDEIYAFFPDQIPEYAFKTSDVLYPSIPFTTRYYYKYENTLDQFVDIVAEWKLSQSEYEETKLKAVENAKYIEQKGDWILVHYRDDSGYYVDRYIFAYNDRQKKVRYIADITIGTRSNPYYLSLDW